MMTTEEKLEEMGRRCEVYKLGYADGVKGMGLCLICVIVIIAIINGVVIMYLR